MRLIDADKLKADNPRHMGQDVPYCTEETVEEIIDNAPTVEAVPLSVIEDIKSELSDKELFYRKQNRSDYKRYGEAFDMCLRIIQKHTSGKDMNGQTDINL